MQKKIAPKKATSVKSATPKKWLQGKETIQLIDGEFLAGDANDLLMELMNHKINFHQLRSFSMEERLGSAGEQSMTRLAELRKDRERLQSILDYAAKRGLKLDVQSKIEIRVAK